MIGRRIVLHRGAVVALALTALGCAPTPPIEAATATARAPAPPGEPQGAVIPPAADGLLRSEACTADGWCADHPRPYLGSLNDVWIPSADDGFAVGDGGLFARRVTTDGGRATWLFGNSGLQYDLEAVFGAGTDVYAVGDRGLLLRWSHGAWARQDVPTKEALLDVWTDGESVVVVGVRGTALRRRGGQWEELSVSTARGRTGNFNVVWGAGRQLWLGDSGGQVHHFDGERWTDAEAIGVGWVGGLHGDGSELFAVVFDRALAHFDGETWNVHRPFRETDWRDVLRLGPGRAVAVGNGSFIAEHRDGVWRRGAEDFPPLTAVGASGPSDVIAVGATIAHFDGKRWSPQIERPNPPPVNAVWASAGTVYAAANEGTILRRGEDGWQVAHRLAEKRHALFPDKPELTTRLDYLQGIWASGPDDVVVVGNDRNLVTFDGGAWSAVTTSFRIPPLSGVWGLDDRVYAVGGAVLRRDGRDWRREEVPQTAGLNDVWGTSEDDVWIVGYTDVVHFDGHAWTPNHDAFAALPEEHRRYPEANGVWTSGPDDVFIAVKWGILHFDGSAWSYTNASDIEGEGVIPSDRESVYAIRGSGPRDVWAVGQYGFVAHYDGERWHRERSGTDTLLRGLCVTEDAIYAAGTAGILRRKRR